tara:strand:+ start:586 stop:756 length:171 start_codon:yes stop_codon:yes gene_type:complete
MDHKGGKGSNGEGGGVSVPVGIPNPSKLESGKGGSLGESIGGNKSAGGSSESIEIP